MKAKNFRLLATMITLAAVTMISYPADAQRRNTGTRNTTSRETTNVKSRKSAVKNIQRKNYETRPQSSAYKETVKSSAVKRRQTGSSARVPQKSSVQRQGKSVAGQARDIRNRQVQTERAGNKSSRSSQKFNVENRERTRISGAERSRRSTGDNHSARISGSENNRNYGSSASRERSDRRSSFTRIDESDHRYQPSRSYRGSNKTWTSGYRPSSMNYNHTDRNFYRKYNYNSCTHWDRSWERYRWNVNSWRDYYHGYNPYSFTYSKYYFHHRRYGHVLRKFIYQPVVFYHNHHRYYCYDGHFFRYHRGIGYVLVEIPFGFTFDFLPADYEMVYINGYPYYRVGNLFFENSGFGFRLIHYPERYISVEFGFALNYY